MLRGRERLSRVPAWLKLHGPNPFIEVEALSVAPMTTDLPLTPAAPRPRHDSGRYEAGSIVAGKYELSQILGQGGMGSVWLAKNRTLDVDVALKLMRTELAEEVDGVAERMLQEARAAASVGHPAIVQVFDFGFSERGDPFIVMEVLHGESLLAAMKRRGKLSPTRAVQTLLPIVEALAATHARGIVHRDLKPENIFLSRPAGNRLQPKVLDFGIAKLEQRAQERLTRGGAVIGSPAYMSPEQLRGEDDVDGRADVWALSVVLYQMLTERRPFDGDSYHASMWNVLNAEPRPIAEHGIADAELWGILAAGLAKDRRERHPDMLTFGRALAAWLLERGVQNDICDASLRTWLAEGAAAVGSAPSFFPSQHPGNDGLAATRNPFELVSETVAQPERIEVRGIPKLPPVAVVPVRPDAVDIVPAPTRAVVLRAQLNGWIVGGVVAAAAAFLVAAFWFGQRRADLDGVLSAVGLGGLASSGALEGNEEGEAAGEEIATEGRTTSSRLPELPRSRVQYAPLPKNGPNAPLIYVDGANRR